MKRLDIKNPFSQAPVYYRDVTDSTMEDCKKDLSGGIVHGSVYQAGFQNLGRGRIRGRKWISESGQNLMFTVVFRKVMLNKEINHMPLIIGMALAEAVSEFTNKNFQLKWPNDLLFKGKKTAGILCEADNEYFYSGLGINCNQIQFPEDLQKKTTSLSLITEAQINLTELLQKILEKIKYYSENDDLWRTGLEKILYKKGEIIEILEGRAGEGIYIKGRNLGIGRDGQLILENKDGEILDIYAGEIEI